MANSPRPAVWSLERSTDYGKTFSTWYYFASDMECRTVFKMEPFVNRSFVRDDDVVCETKYASRIPLEGYICFVLHSNMKTFIRLIQSTFLEVKWLFH